VPHIGPACAQTKKASSDAARRKEQGLADGVTKVPSPAHSYPLAEGRAIPGPWNRNPPLPFAGGEGAAGPIRWAFLHAPPRGFLRAYLGTGIGRNTPLN
jgi:hypothetical protein